MPESEPKTILIIEDERHISEALEINLALKGYQTVVAPDGVTGLELWRTRQPDLIVLDIMLPGIDGFAILQNIRLEDEMVPILILSAKTEPADRVRGLAAGVDDYLTKPFELKEFLLRVERLLTRASWNQPVAGQSPSRIHTFGDNQVDLATGRAVCRQKEIELTGQEIKLLKVFLANPGKPVSRQTLLKVGWGYSGATSTRTVDNFVVRLRKYFEVDPKHPRFFKSRRSVGYIFDPNP